MHQHPPKMPPCFSTRRAKAGQVSVESGLAVSVIVVSRDPVQGEDGKGPPAGAATFSSGDARRQETPRLPPGRPGTSLPTRIIGPAAPDILPAPGANEHRVPARTGSEESRPEANPRPDPQGTMPTGGEMTGCPGCVRPAQVIRRTAEGAGSGRGSVGHPGADGRSRASRGGRSTSRAHGRRERGHFPGARRCRGASPALPSAHHFPGPELPHPATRAALFARRSRRIRECRGKRRSSSRPKGHGRPFRSHRERSAARHPERSVRLASGPVVPF